MLTKNLKETLKLHFQTAVRNFPTPYGKKKIWGNIKPGDTK